MGNLTLNTIFGCLLAVLLVLMGLHELSHSLFAPEKAHHDDHGEVQTLNEKIAASYAYYVEIEDAGAAPGAVEEVFDLGLALANADPARGESSFKQKCQSCHAIEQGGGNGIGPALWNVVGAEKAANDGFRYSGALSGFAGDWGYEELNAWLKNPSGYVSGTSMAFAGLNRDSERANVIAYMAQMSEAPPEFPEPEGIDEDDIDDIEPMAGQPVIVEEETKPTLETGEVAVQEVDRGNGAASAGGVTLVPEGTEEFLDENAEPNVPFEGAENEIDQLPGEEASDETE